MMSLHALFSRLSRRTERHRARRQAANIRNTADGRHYCRRSVSSGGQTPPAVLASRSTVKTVVSIRLLIAPEELPKLE